MDRGMNCDYLSLLPLCCDLLSKMCRWNLRGFAGFSFGVLVLTFLGGAVGDHCFQNREPVGNLGNCTIQLGTGMTQAECCAAGGAGWTTEANGERCEDACADVDGVWSAWSEWSDCPVTCGGSNRTRERECNNPPPQHGGLDCEGEPSQTEECGNDPCPVDGVWSAWSEWSDCPVTCGGSNRTRERECNNPPPQHGGLDCEGDLSQTEECGNVPCPPVDGNWTEWSDWGGCSETCSDGIMKRTRSCTNPEPAYGGAICDGKRKETVACNDGPCPIDGVWSAWSEWSDCPVTCGGSNRARERECNNPPPQHGGFDCVGEPSQTEECANDPCPVNGNWSEWSEWSECSRTCEEGIRTRERTCTNPTPQFGGDDCEGETNETTVCSNPKQCPVHGQWSEWTPWTLCEAPRCDMNGTQTRRRTCTNPSPRRGGRYCQNPGLVNEEQTCQRLCAYWSEWSDWGPCNGGCTGGGFQKRYRKCLGEGALPSSEPFQEYQTCDTCIQDDEDYEMGSGSGDGSGEGEDTDVSHEDRPVVGTWSPLCTDAESCQCEGGGPDEGADGDDLSYSDIGGIPDEEHSDDYDYSQSLSVDYTGVVDPDPDPQSAGPDDDSYSVEDPAVGQQGSPSAGNEIADGDPSSDGDGDDGVIFDEDEDPIDDGYSYYNS